MSKSKVQKVAIVSGVEERLGRMQGAVLADFTGLKMAAIESLRNEARASDCEYLVVKKTLYGRAASAASVPTDDATMTSAMSVLFGFSDPIAPARIAKTFTKANEAFKVLGGLLREGGVVRSLTFAEVKVLGDLPSRDVLIAQAVGSIAAPLRGFVGALQGNLRNLLGVLGAIQKTKS